MSATKIVAMVRSIVFTCRETGCANQNCRRDRPYKRRDGSHYLYRYNGSDPVCSPRCARALEHKFAQ